MPDFNTIDEVVEELAAGRMIVLVDERAVGVDGTELVGEGELVMVAELADSDSVNFMARHAGGPVYVAADRPHLVALGLQQAQTQGPRGAAYMGSVNARRVDGSYYPSTAYRRLDLVNPLEVPNQGLCDSVGK